MRIVPSLCLIAFGLSCLPSGLLAEQPEFRKSATNLDERLKPIPPKEPAEALQSFRAAHGFRMELVACEPDVADPVAAAFDENGLLYVAEMADYPDPYREGRKPLGRVRLLEDSDADGKFDRSWIFAEGICWPTGVVPWKQGIFVAAAPDIWYLKDTDGDHLADVRRQVFTGFGVQNQQGTVNNLAWGFDNRIYGSGSTNGGEIRSAGLPDGEPLSIHRKDFRFDPESETLEAVSGRAQFGNAFDDWGNRFVCSESEPGYHVVLPHEYLARNPYLAVERTIQELAPSPIRIYRTSPIEPWRAIRSQRRIAAGERGLASAGLSHEVIDAAAGLTIYRGDAYPEEFRGDLIIGCSQNNLIHRRKIVPDGVSFHSRRADKDTELVQSSDTWFRPVNCIHAPDGTLYVLDMSREVIEAIHIPLDVVARLDLASGRDRGRIYRLAPPGFQLRVAPRLGSADTLELVRTLEHRAGWWRDTASRLLYERQDPAAIGPLRALLRTSDFPQARLHALWALQGLRALDESDAMFALSDPSEHLREHAVRLAEPLLTGSSTVYERVVELASDPAPRVRFQVAFSLGSIADQRAAAALALIARRDAADRWVQAAILSSCEKLSGDVLLELMNDSDFANRSGRALFNQLAMILGASQNVAKIEAVCAAMNQIQDASWKRPLFSSLASGIRQRGATLEQLFPDVNSPARKLLASQIDAATRDALDPELAIDQRAEAIDTLRHARFDQAAPLARRLLAYDQPDRLRRAAINMLAAMTESNVADVLLEYWPQYGPALQEEAARLVLSRPAWIERMLALVETDAVPADSLGAALRSRLVNHNNRQIAEKARQLLGEATSDRAGVIEQYRSALSLPGDANLGAAIYERECSACHRLGDRGNELGPNLMLTRNRSPEALLIHILDPNREVPPKYVQYVAIDTSGRTINGIMTAETATSITLARERGVAETLLKSNIDDLSSTGRSVMPEGFERTITPHDMAHLLAFLLDVQYDVGTIPGEDIPGQEGALIGKE